MGQVRRHPGSGRRAPLATWAARARRRA